MRLNGKVAIVTGGASGFGQGIAETYAREGAKVAILDINSANADNIAVKIGGFSVTCDVTSASDVAKSIETVHQKYGKIDILVNNAGISHRNQPMLDVSEEEYDRVFAVNVKSIFHFAKNLVPIFRKQKSGFILNIGSTAGIRPRPGLAWYNATKGAVNLLTKSMATELAADKIRVCALAPVAGETPLLSTFLGSDSPEIRAKFLATVPLGRFSNPQDIANAALFLASDEADFLTGVVLEVDGGRCI